MDRLSGAMLAEKVGDMQSSFRRRRRAGMGLALLFGIPLLTASDASGGEPPRATAEQLKLGQELFAREWKPNDPRCHGGDGLGPVYNETSCVACHGEGGPGGAGPAGMNVQVISLLGGEFGLTGEKYMSLRGVVIGGTFHQNIPGIKQSYGRLYDMITMQVSPERAVGKARNGFVVSANGISLKTWRFEVKTDPADGDLMLSCAEGKIKGKSFTIRPDDDALRKIHPGFIAAPSAVIHHFGVDPGYEDWRSRLKARIPAPRTGFNRGLEICGGNIVATERNAPPLFGLGLIDALPHEVLIATAEQEPAQVRGRVSRLTSGRIGRFGWKAQTADLHEFVLAACASELGLEVPGHGQSISPLAPDARAKAPDLIQEECNALVAYVRGLPAPVLVESTAPEDVIAGRGAFVSIGCADCHRPNLGNIEGIYSDLLLHDMGPDLVSVMMTPYYGPDRLVDLPTSASMADGSEWRTPPLWGYRDSGPYLHDGRARGLHEVVKAHGGQARESAARFAALSPLQRSRIEIFLKTLAAPPSATPTVVPDSHKSRPAQRSMLGPSSTSPPARPTTLSALADAADRAKQERTAASRLKLAQSLEQMDKPQGALVFYREIVRDEPGTAAARTAAERIKALGGEVNPRTVP